MVACSTMAPSGIPGTALPWSGSTNYLVNLVFAPLTNGKQPQGRFHAGDIAFCDQRSDPGVGHRSSVGGQHAKQRSRQFESGN
jgi:hypothetical protein